MISFDEIRMYLPKYLSPEAENRLFDELNHFPSNIDSRIYTGSLSEEEVLFQGDGIRDLEFHDPPDPQIKLISCMVLSNTCDVDPVNRRFLSSAICYAPIVKMEVYKSILIEEGITEERIADHFEAIRHQKQTGIFFLPKGGNLETDSLVLLDRICHCSSEMVDRKMLPTRRLFVLSDYGAYLFLLKLSIHFTRLTDQVARSAVQNAS